MNAPALQTLSQFNTHTKFIKRQKGFCCKSRDPKIVVGAYFRRSNTVTMDEGSSIYTYIKRVLPERVGSGGLRNESSGLPVSLVRLSNSNWLPLLVSLSSSGQKMGRKINQDARRRI